MLQELHIHLHNTGLYLSNKGEYDTYLMSNNDTFKEGYLENRWEEILKSYELLKGLKADTLTDMVKFVVSNYDSLEK
tara:strand:+ start:378 stop:608 length:231 start_codon:yes stop_codon:yes gene_type:complete